MKAFLALLIGCIGFVQALAATNSLTEVLQAMPLPVQSRIDRENAIEVILDAFQSNGVVKGILFLPGVADDFYLIHRDAPKLNLRATNLLEAIHALTNATAVRATFQAPFLLMHVERDSLKPICVAEDGEFVRTLKGQVHLRHVLWKDTHWEQVQPTVRKALSRSVTPAASSTDAWHFNRHNLAAWALTDWELLTGLSLAGGTRVTVQKQGIRFDVRGTP